MTIRKLFVWATLTALLPCLVHGQGAAPKGSLNITAEQPELRSDRKGNMVIEFNINPGGIRLTPDEQLVVVPVIKEPGGKSRCCPGSSSTGAGAARWRSAWSASAGAAETGIPYTR